MCTFLYSQGLLALGKLTFSFNSKERAAVAQLVEQWSTNLRVGGLGPSSSGPHVEVLDKALACLQHVPYDCLCFLFDFIALFPELTY